MGGVVTGVMSERAKRERVFINRMRRSDQRRDEIARADVMHQVREKTAPEWVVPEVLDQRAAIGVRTRRLDLLERGTRKCTLQQGRNLLGPCIIDQRLVRQYRVRR